MNKKLTRREALRWIGLTAAASLAACTPIARSTLSPSAPAAAPTSGRTPEESQTETPLAETATQPPAEPTAGQAYLSVARGADPAAITEAALKALGGIERFVKNGYDVIIKPNICTDYLTYEYAATTNPLVVAALVRLALGAGAKRVRVMDSPFGGSARSAYAKSGIAKAVQEAGGEMEIMNPNKFRATKIPDGKSITEWDIYQDVLNCDLLIDVPIAKNHDLSVVTLGGKNLMGVIQDRGAIHADLPERISDLLSVIRPGLTVVDGVRTLLHNGPTGGRLEDVKLTNTVIASHDLVAADATAAGLFGLTGADVPYIARAAERGLGRLDLSGLKVEEISL